MSQWPSEHDYTIPVAPGPDVVTVTIDDKVVQAPRGELLIKVAQQHGTFIPRFCYHERMRPVGMCRMCLVEVEGLRGLQISSAVPVTDGMVVRTTSDAVKKVQDGILEFLLINHPLDCPVCDRGGECPLQDYTLTFGPGESRFIEEKRHFEKPIPLSDLVLLDRERCIQCGRCTRFAAEIAGDALIDFGARGDATEVITFPGESFASHFSGNTVQLCPVGALTSRPYRFKARPWDLTSVETTCQVCAVGCRGELDATSNRIVRFLGVDSEPVNHGWLCDKGRYGYEWVHAEDRLRAPVVRRGRAVETVSWPEALDAVAARLRQVVDQHGPETIAVLGGAQATNEDAFAFAWLAKGVLGTDNVDAQLGDGLPADLVLGLPSAVISDLERAAAIVLLAPDLEEELPVLHLRVRRAVVELRVPLVEIAARDSGLSPYVDVPLRHLPADPAVAVESLRAVLAGGPGRTRELSGLAAALAGREGPIVVVLGRPSLAESPDATVHAASVLAGVPRVRFLPALRGANTRGALDLGLAPGFLPGRVTLDTGRRHYESAWGRTPAARGLDAAGILAACAAGDMRALVLLGADPLADFPDRQLARAALENVEYLVAVGAFVDEAASYANVVLPVTVWGEQTGTTSNLEGRVQRLGQAITPEGATMEPWRVAGELAARLGTDFGFTDPESVQDAIARTAPAFAGVDAGVVRRARDGAVIPVAEHADEIAYGTDRLRPDVSWEPIPPEPLEAAPGEAEPAQAEGDGSGVRWPAPPVTLHTWRGTQPAPSHAPVDAYALRLVAGRTLYGADRVTTSSRPLGALAPGAWLLVNARDRDRIGVVDGTNVRVTTARGSVEVPIRADAHTPEGVAFCALNQEGPSLAEVIAADAFVTDLRVETLS